MTEFSFDTEHTMFCIYIEFFRIVYWSALEANFAVCGMDEGVFSPDGELKKFLQVSLLKCQEDWQNFQETQMKKRKNFWVLNVLQMRIIWTSWTLLAKGMIDEETPSGKGETADEYSSNFYENYIEEFRLSTAPMVDLRYRQHRIQSASLHPGCTDRNSGWTKFERVHQLQVHKCFEYEQTPHTDKLAWTHAWSWLAHQEHHCITETNTASQRPVFKFVLKIELKKI